MQTRAISKDDMTAFVGKMLADYRVIAPVEAEPGFFRFDEIEDVREVVLDYVTTVLPPKKAVFPQRQVLLEFSQNDGKPSFEAVIDRTPQVLLGAHPCDLAGMGMLDWAFERDHPDEHYLTRRRATAVIGVDCLPDAHCFCTAVGTDSPRGDFDLFLTPIADGYLIAVGSEKGQRLLETYAQTRGAEPADMAAAGQFHKEKRAGIRRQFDTDVLSLPLTFQHGVGSPAWAQAAEPCLSCGACNLVCPTCYCFDVEDTLFPDGQGGVRERVWDSCQLADFARVSGGHSFRSEAAARLRHRFYRKYQYLMTLYGMPFCTGCGRCGRACPVEITVVDTINKLVADGRKEAGAHAG